MQRRLPGIVLCLCGSLMAQHRVDLRNTHERVLCVVPLVGSGTPADPVRPQYAPLPQTDGTAPSRDGIIAFTFQLADDGKHALAEFVAENQSAFKDLLADTNPEVKIFKKGKHKREDIEKEFKKHKKDIDLDNFEVAVP